MTDMEQKNMQQNPSMAPAAEKEEIRTIESSAAKPEKFKKLEDWMAKAKLFMTKSKSTEKTTAPAPEPTATTGKASKGRCVLNALQGFVSFVGSLLLFIGSGISFLLPALFLIGIGAICVLAFRHTQAIDLTTAFLFPGAVFLALLSLGGVCIMLGTLCRPLSRRTNFPDTREHTSLFAYSLGMCMKAGLFVVCLFALPWWYHRLSTVFDQLSEMAIANMDRCCIAVMIAFGIIYALYAIAQFANHGYCGSCEATKEPK